jgi:hypothetical protein
VRKWPESPFVVDQEERMKHRYSPRVPVEGSAVFANDEMTGEGRVIDLSLPGCLLETPKSVRSGEYVRLKLSLPDKKSPMNVPLAVVRWAVGNRIGLEFIRSSEEDQARLSSFFRHHRCASFSSGGWQGGIEIVAAAGN